MAAIARDEAAGAVRNAECGRALCIALNGSARYTWAWDNKSLDASGGSVFRNLLRAAEGALIRAAASTQTFDAFQVPVIRSSSMFRRCAIAVALIAITGMAFPTSLHKSSVVAQQAAIGHLSTEQRRAVQLRISTNATPSGFYSRAPVADKLIFKVGEPIHVGILMTNTVNESVRVCAFSNPYYQNRPHLTRNGEVLGYSNKITELIRQSDVGFLCEFTRTPDIADLKPNVPLRVPSIELDEWYTPLTPGHYRMFLKRTFACCADGQWNSSNEINFDVTP